VAELRFGLILGPSTKRGENNGKLLHHVNVVRNFTSTDNKSGTVSLTLPDQLSAKDCRIIAFVQNNNTLHIEAATAATVQ